MRLINSVLPICPAIDYQTLCKFAKLAIRRLIPCPSKATVTSSSSPLVRLLTTIPLPNLTCCTLSPAFHFGPELLLDVPAGFAEELELELAAERLVVVLLVLLQVVAALLAEAAPQVVARWLPLKPLWPPPVPAFCSRPLRRLAGISPRKREGLPGS